MDPIFKSNIELKKEYLLLYKNFLPLLNNCGNCNKFSCDYCLKFSVNCSSCIRGKCQNCFEFNRSKDILINSTDVQISDYVSNFLTDYFNASELSNQFFKMNITEEVKEKDPTYTYSGKIKKIFCYEEEKTDSKIKYRIKGKKCQLYLK